MLQPATLRAQRKPAMEDRALPRKSVAFQERATAWLESLSRGAEDHFDLVMAIVEGLTANQLLHPGGRVTWKKMTEERRLVLNSLMH